MGLTLPASCSAVHALEIFPVKGDAKLLLSKVPAHLGSGPPQFLSIVCLEAPGASQGVSMCEGLHDESNGSQLFFNFLSPS